jgi:hypothetical protein
VDQCEELQAVPYALKKYQELKEQQPFDEIANEMHKKVLVKNFAKKSINQIKSQMSDSYLMSLPWARYVRVATWILPVTFIIWGLFQSHLRNLIGLGVSFLFLRVAVQLFIKGEINIKDIWR